MTLDDITRKLRLLIAGLWAGNLWTIGALVAPALFATLADRALAGTIAGTLFHWQFWCSIACGTLLLGLVSRIRPNRTLLLLIVAMLVCALLNQYGIRPEMALLKAQAAGGQMVGADKARFGMLHGVSSAIYLLQSSLSLVLLWRMR